MIFYGYTFMLCIGDGFHLESVWLKGNAKNIFSEFLTDLRNMADCRSLATAIVIYPHIATEIISMQNMETEVISMQD
jgi:hypothetical protein